jgi:hypothetical protein
MRTCLIRFLGRESEGLTASCSVILQGNHTPTCYLPSSNLHPTFNLYRLLNDSVQDLEHLPWTDSGIKLHTSQAAIRGILQPYRGHWGYPDETGRQPGQGSRTSISETSGRGKLGH